MNREKLEAKLRNYEERLKDVAKAIKETREQLDEKPKLRHGDFGLDPSGFGRLALQGLQCQMFSAGTGCCLDQDTGDRKYPKIIFGNIFDLMKDWGDDLTKFELDVHKYFIDERADMSHAPIHIAGNWHTETEAYKFWCNLGQMIMTLKRKENSCS